MMGNFSVEEASSGQCAVTKYEELYPDIVLLDVMMPDMDGFETCAALRKLPGTQYTPILMITGLDDLDSIERAYQVGASNFVTKPINAALLRHHVNYMLRASRAEAALRTSEERYALAARGANDGLWDWDLLTNTVHYSERWQTMLGYDDSELGNHPESWLERVHQNDIERVRTALDSHINGHSAHFESEYRIRAKDRSYRWVLCRGLAVRNAQGKAYRMAGSQTDITDRKCAEEQLLHDAFHDALTGLPNRSLFLEQVDQCLKRSRRLLGYTFAVIFLDLDRFKNINDSLGHVAGDQLLIEFSDRIKQCLRETDTLARFGGDEFTILVENIEGVQHVIWLMERIQTVLVEPFELAGQTVFVTTSMGITLSNPPYAAAGAMLRDADAAMYRAKALGRNRYAIFDEKMHAHAVNVLQIETELKTAIARSQFCLHYQPIVKLPSSDIAGFEALLRWQHPTRGLLIPEDFLPVAEDTGIIIPIGHWVLQEACAQMRAWQDELSPSENMFISVNISPVEFGDPGFFGHVCQVLESTRLDPRALKLEITEHVLIKNSKKAYEILTRLRDIGIQLSIDDFGTGYSSFSYLHQFPFDILKIDRSFIRRLDKRGNSLEIVKAIVSLAHNLGMMVVAEGSETLNEVATLQSLLCEYAQGYAFSGPLNKYDASAVIAESFTDQLNHG
jgi:diguanylate cyclase (GGDEF)-like protein/PAS domain S-box-containing protein